MKSSPDFWIELIWLSGISTFEKVIGGHSEAMNRCARIVAEGREGLDYLLLLWGDYTPGTVAMDAQISASFQNYPIRGGSQWRSL